MKKSIFILFFLSLLVIFGSSVGEASSIATSPVNTPAPDDLVTFSRFDLGCLFDHATIVFNNTDSSAIGSVVDDNGNPDDTCLGFAYIAADFIGTTSLWVSNDGSHWLCVSGPCP